MNRIRALREEMGISQQALADQIGTNQQNIYRYENGINEPDIETLKLIARFFDASIDYVVGNTDIHRRIEAVSEYALTEDEAMIVDKYRRMDKRARHIAGVLVDALLDGEK